MNRGVGRFSQTLIFLLQEQPRNPLKVQIHSDLVTNFDAQLSHDTNTQYVLQKFNPSNNMK